jgi:hypothetical protein
VRSAQATQRRLAYGAGSISGLSACLTVCVLYLAGSVSIMREMHRKHMWCVEYPLLCAPQWLPLSLTGPSNRSRHVMHTTPSTSPSSSSSDPSKALPEGARSNSRPRDSWLVLEGGGAEGACRGKPSSLLAPSGSETGEEGAGEGANRARTYNATHTEAGTKRGF